MTGSKLSEEVGDLENMPLTYTNQNELILEKSEIGESLRHYRIINTLSILFLLMAVFSIFYYSSNSFRAYNDFFNPKFTHFQIDLIMFLFIWGFIIILSSINALFRNVFINEKDREEQKEIVNVLEKQFKHYFPLGNIFFSIYIFLNILKYLEFFGINIIFALLSIFCYSISYINYKKATHTQGLISFVAFNVNVSLLLAWNSCLFIISIFSFLENYDNFFRISNIIIYAYICHFLLCSITIILISYHNDIFFGSLILLFQIGIVIRSKNFYSNENKLNFILCLFNALCLVYVLIFDNRQIQTNLICKEDVETICKSYKKVKKDKK